MNRADQFLLIVATLFACWLGMQQVHELGHVLGAWVTGGRVERVVLSPWVISRTDLSVNPHPLFVVWAGPLVGVVLPMVLWGVICAVGFAHRSLLSSTFALSGSWIRQEFSRLLAIVRILGESGYSVTLPEIGQSKQCCVARIPKSAKVELRRCFKTRRQVGGRGWSLYETPVDSGPGLSDVQPRPPTFGVFKHLLRFFAGFCLLANGLYIGIGAFDRVGDCDVMLQQGSSLWQLWMFGGLTAPLGLWLWHGQGVHFGFGGAGGEVDRRAVVGSVGVCVVLLLIGLVVGDR